MVSYNIGHLAFLNAKRYGISRLFFGGFFIRGHPYTMDVISYAIRFWSKGEMHACFLRHEGFLGAMGAFLEGHPQLATGVATGAEYAARYAGGDSAPGGASHHAPEGLQVRRCSHPYIVPSVHHCSLFPAFAVPCVASTAVFSAVHMSARAARVCCRTIHVL